MTVNPRDWNCKTCGEFYPKGEKKKFVHYCCDEQAHAELERAINNLKNGLEDLASIQELDDFLKDNEIKPLED